MNRITSLPMRWTLISGGLLLLLIAVAAGWAFGRADEDAAWQQVQASGVIHVGLDAAYPPFEVVDEKGNIIGFDVDLANEIAGRLGVRVQFHNITYDALFDKLLIGEVDTVISAMVIAPEFAGKASFSIPYFSAGEHLIVPRNADTLTMSSLDGRSLAVEYGSGGDVEARAWERRLAALDILRYDNAGAAVNAVAAGEADAALVDGITARYAVAGQPTLQMGEMVTETYYGVAVHPDSLVLLDAINTALQDMLADGTINAITARWFGEIPE